MGFSPLTSRPALGKIVFHKTKIVIAASVLLSTHSPAAPQSHDPVANSPLMLLTTPPDPIAYRDRRARVQVLLNDRKAAEAERLAEQITREYPRDGENWNLLGQAKMLLSKYREAAAAYERAGALLNWGGPVRSAALAAVSHALAGNRRAALDLLRRHISEGGNLNRSWIHDHEAFKSFRTDPEFLAIAGRPATTGWTRVNGWRDDLIFLRNEVKRLNADYRHRPLPAEFERRYQALMEGVPQLSDEQIFVGMNRALAVLRQGHTGVAASAESRIPPKGLPFQLWVFPEGLFIVSADQQHEALIGFKLVSIEGVPAEEALRRVNETQSVDGDNEYLFLGPKLLREAPFLVGLGLAKSTDSVRFTVQKPGEGPRTITVATVSAAVPNRLMPLARVKPPLFMQEPRRAHFEKALPEHDALYLQIDLYDQSQAEVALRLRRTLGALTGPKNLILDMRFNEGGSTDLYAEMLRTMIGFSLVPERQLYVLIGRNTYSAAGNFITELEQLAKPVFLGEASSECCTFYGSPSPFTLPFSKLSGRMSTKRWSLSRRADDFRRELNPHVPVTMTAQDYFAGRDPVLATALRLIERSKIAASSEASVAARPASR